MSDRRPLALAALAGALALGAAACGDDSSTTGSGGGGGGQATASSSATSSSVSSTGSSTSDGGGGQGTGGAGGDGVGGSGGDPEACSSDLAAEITFVVTNDTPDRLWFQGSGFGRTRLAGIVVDGHAEPDCPCDDLGSCSGSQATVSTDIGFLDPGESFEEIWQGLHYEEDPICSEELSCQPGRTPRAGDLTGVVTAYLGAPFCSGDCDCNLSQGNICNYGDGAETPTDPLEATVVFSFPDVTTVDVAFTIDR